MTHVACGVGIQVAKPKSKPDMSLQARSECQTMFVELVGGPCEGPIGPVVVCCSGSNNNSFAWRRRERRRKRSIDEESSSDMASANPAFDVVVWSYESEY